MKKLLAIIGFAALVFSAASCSCSGNRGKNAVEDDVDTTVYTLSNLPDEPIFDITTNLGTIRVKLYSETPKHRDNFVKLVREHYYDGVLFHRVINGFMIQAGDPLTKYKSRMDEWGTGGPDYTIPAEIIPKYYHKKGALAAARKGDAANPRKASNGSQFYLVQDEENTLQLDGEYTIFGETVQGFDVIDRIASVPTDERDRPLKDVKILSITLSADQHLTPDSSDSYDSDWIDDYYDDDLTQEDLTDEEDANNAAGEEIEENENANAAMDAAAKGEDSGQPVADEGQEAAQSEGQNDAVSNDEGSAPEGENAAQAENEGAAAENASPDAQESGADDGADADDKD